MTSAPRVAALDGELAARAGTVSVWCGPVGSSRAAYARLADAAHYAASTMKVAVLVALYRAHAAGSLDIDAEVPVVNDFASALPGAPRFAIDRDRDDGVWDRLGGPATLRWLARQMIVRSSNLATNVVLAHVDARYVPRLVGATRMRLERGIGDTAARDAGIDNVVTARDLAILLGAVTDPEVIEVLCAQEHREDLAAGLPAGTRAAHKSGWVTGVRHAAGIVYPADARPYTIVVCTTGTGDDAPALIARIVAASWADRHDIAR
jgi:beta-lactamase class A